MPPFASALPRTRPASVPVLLALAFVLVPFGNAIAGVPAAGVPDPRFSNVEQVMIGSWNGVPAAAGDVPCGPVGPGFEVLVRDVNAAPLPGHTVVLRFAGSGVRPHSLQNAGTTVSCPLAELSMVTNAAGIARFAPRLAGYNLAGGVSVLADGIQLSVVRVISPDYNGDGAMTLVDFAIFGADFLGPVPQARSDFDNCPTTLLGDFAYFGAQYLAGLNQPAVGTCP